MGTNGPDLSLHQHIWRKDFGKGEGNKRTLFQVFFGDNSIFTKSIIFIIYINLIYLVGGLG
jgi:hypothetical protein